MLRWPSNLDRLLPASPVRGSCQGTRRTTTAAATDNNSSNTHSRTYILIHPPSNMQDSSYTAGDDAGQPLVSYEDYAGSGPYLDQSHFEDTTQPTNDQTSMQESYGPSLWPTMYQQPAMTYGASAHGPDTGLSLLPAHHYQTQHSDFGDFLSVPPVKELGLEWQQQQ